MPDKKLTDKEIIKALECLFGCVDCRECPYSPRYEFPLCQRQVAKDTLDLITRKQAKIDDLMARTAVTTLLDDAVVYTPTLEDYNKFKKKFKSEAVKEFAETVIDRVEKAKAKYQRLCKEQGEEMEEHMHIHFNGIIGIINNLLKELVGDDNA